jgi:hypothetical protein
MAGKIADFNRGKRRVEHREYKNLSETIRRKMKRIDLLKQTGNQPAIDAEMCDLSKLDRQRKALPSADPLDAGYRRLTYIRYADDFLIGIIGSRLDAYFGRW